MFIGHSRSQFGAKRRRPSCRWARCFIGVPVADLLWPIMLVLGLEKVEIDPGNTLMTPLQFQSAIRTQHSLVMLLSWSALFALGYRIARAGDRRDRRRSRAGLQSLRARRRHASARHADHDLRCDEDRLRIVESSGHDAGDRVGDVPAAPRSNRASRARRIGRRIGFYALIVVLVAIYFAALYGPPPPSASAIAVAGT
jgi:hypothetical protein